MTREQLERAVAAYTNKGGSITRLPEVKPPVTLKDALNIAERVIDKHLAINPVERDEDDINFRGVEEVSLALPEGAAVKL
jgi:hypothetical protein